MKFHNFITIAFSVNQHVKKLVFNIKLTLGLNMKNLDENQIKRFKYQDFKNNSLFLHDWLTKDSDRLRSTEISKLKNSCSEGNHIFVVYYSKYEFLTTAFDHS